MKLTLAAIALALSASGALAQATQSTLAKVPTGIDVKGKTNYVLVDTAVIQIDCTRLRSLLSRAERDACYRSYTNESATQTETAPAAQ